MKFDLTNTTVDGSLYGKAVRGLLMSSDNWVLVGNNTIYTNGGIVVDVEKVDEVPPVGFIVNGQYFQVSNSFYYIVDENEEEKVDFI